MMVPGILCASAAVQAASAQFVREEPKFNIQSKDVAEASGVAISPQDGKFMWVVNDSGAKPILHLAGTDGTDRGRVAVEDADNVDWEDLSSFELDGVPYLLIADTGDNNSKRDNCKFYIVREPALPKAGTSLDGKVKPAWTISFGFEDGPRDCESVAVDAAAGKIILVSKRTKPPVVYEMPLRPEDGGKVTAKRIGETSVALPEGMMKLPYTEQPTGMDIASDGSQAVIVSYWGVFLFPREKGESWKDVFARPAVRLTPHGMSQAESIAFSKDGKSITLLSERGDSRVVTYRR